MNLLFPDSGLVEQLKRVLTGSVHYHLYTNNLTPTLATVLGDFTEAAWTSYAVATRTWTDFATNGVAAHNGYALATPIAFLNTSGATVNPYGYYVTDTGDAILLACARFDGPPSPIVNGGSLLVVPTWGDFSQLSS
jgi:hypothetical protein